MPILTQGKDAMHATAAAEFALRAAPCVKAGAADTDLPDSMGNGIRRAVRQELVGSG